MDSLEAFLRYLASERNYSLNTIRAYRKDLTDFGDHICDPNGNKIFSDVTYPLIRNFIVNLSKRGISMRTINRKCAALNTFYNFLQKINSIDFHPMANHKSLKAKKSFIMPFSLAEVDKVLNQIDVSNFSGLRDAISIELLYVTGIRQSELTGLKTTDIDWAQTQLRVLGKRNKERIIPILPSILSRLSKYLELRKMQQFSSSHNYLLVTNKGKKTYPSFIYRLIHNSFKEVSKKIHVSPHVLRHSFATHMLDAGADINAVKEILGHESLAATQEYTKIQLPKVQEAYHNAHPRAKK